MIYELRWYEVSAQRRSADLHALFANHAVPLLQKHGIGILGFWVPKIGRADEIPCIWVFEDMADREAKMAAFEGDPEWQEAKAEADKNVFGSPVTRVRSILLRPTDFSPEPRIARNIQEFRVNGAMPGRIADLHHLFANQHNAIWFPKHDIRVVGWFDEAVGTSDQIFFIMEYPSVAEQDRRFDDLRKDAGWGKCALPYEKDGPLRRRSYHTLLELTDYTPRGQYVSAPEVGSQYVGYAKDAQPG